MSGPWSSLHKKGAFLPLRHCLRKGSRATGDPRNPTAVVLGPSDIAVAWENWSATGAEDIYLSRGDGSIWSAPANMSRSAIPSVNPTLAADPSQRLQLVWAEVAVDGTHHILYSGEWLLPFNYYLPLASR